MEPIEIEITVANSGGMSISQQIVATVDIEGAADGSGKVREFMTSSDEFGDTRGHIRIMFRQYGVNLGTGIEDDAFRPDFMRIGVRKGIFE
jgi:hypothetical protein